ncbi:methyltransferase domain-containing protein [Mycobacterium shigaense]|uniref:methyltransferase domain-containing protein n=2 Tax=Mycobacterium shigaense TaxID=722731 RepID=UPI000E595F93|nr:methyltransferase domain-containing protein [Mycobacterium shigaense]
MDYVTKHHPHDYLPATGHDAFLPAYDVLARPMGMDSVYRQLVRQADIEGGHRVLEICCGTGTLTIEAKRAEPSADVIGCDPNPRILATAKRKAVQLAGVRFERAYAERLPYADGEFDRVLSSIGSLGDAVPTLLRTAGFDCPELATKRQRIIGQLTFYQTTRPA